MLVVSRRQEYLVCERTLFIITPSLIGTWADFRWLWLFMNCACSQYVLICWFLRRAWPWFIFSYLQITLALRLRWAHVEKGWSKRVPYTHTSTANKWTRQKYEILLLRCALFAKWPRKLYTHGKRGWIDTIMVSKQIWYSLCDEQFCHIFHHNFSVFFDKHKKNPADIVSLTIEGSVLKMKINNERKQIEQWQQKNIMSWSQYALFSLIKSAFCT